MYTSPPTWGLSYGLPVVHLYYCPGWATPTHAHTHGHTHHHTPLPAPPWRHTHTRVGYTHPHPSPLTGPPAWACLCVPTHNRIGPPPTTGRAIAMRLRSCPHAFIHTSLNVIDRRHIAPDAATIEGPPTNGSPCHRRAILGARALMAEYTGQNAGVNATAFTKLYALHRDP